MCVDKRLCSSSVVDTKYKREVKKCKVLGDLAVTKSGEIDQARILYCTLGYYTRVWGFLYTGENNKISITYKECKVRQDVSA